MSKAPRVGLGLRVARQGDFGDWLAVPASLALPASPSTLSQRPGHETAAQKKCGRVSDHDLINSSCKLAAMQQRSSYTAS